MAQMYKVFINNHPLYISNDEEINSQINLNNCIMVINPDKERIREILQDYRNNVIVKSYYIRNSNCEDLLKYFFSDHLFIEAAGGVVVNKYNQILFIYRNDKWDLPKGKVEKNESIREAAIREVQEECSIKPDAILEELTPTYHVYPLKGNWVFKTTYWYLMKYSGNEIPLPQTEEGITRIEWKNINNLQEVYANTYTSITDVLKSLTDKLD